MGVAGAAGLVRACGSFPSHPAGRLGMCVTPGSLSRVPSGTDPESNVTEQAQARSVQRRAAQQPFGHCRKTSSLFMLLNLNHPPPRL